MDYSSNSDDAADTGSQSFEEPEVVSEISESPEPDFAEPAQAVEVPEAVPVGQTSMDDPQADDIGTTHPKIDGFEESGTLEAEPIGIRVNRDWGPRGVDLGSETKPNNPEVEKPETIDVEIRGPKLPEAREIESYGGGPERGG